jgi:hypothetical protein
MRLRFLYVEWLTKDRSEKLLESNSRSNRVILRPNANRLGSIMTTRYIMRYDVSNGQIGRRRLPLQTVVYRQFTIATDDCHCRIPKARLCFGGKVSVTEFQHGSTEPWLYIFCHLVSGPLRRGRDSVIPSEFRTQGPSGIYRTSDRYFTSPCRIQHPASLHSGTTLGCTQVYINFGLAAHW